MPNFFTRANDYIQQQGIAIYVWSPFWVLLGLLLEGISFILFDSHMGGINLGGATLLSLAFFSCGLLAGMTFGVPIPDAGTSASGGTEKPSKSRTNFTKISDWLTKVVIGAGLVEIKGTPEFVLKVAKRLSVSVTSNSQATNNAIGWCVGIILFNCSFGFICGYILIRIIMELFDGESKSSLI